MSGISEIVTLMVFVWLIVSMELAPVSVSYIINVQWLAYIFDIQQCPTTVTDTENRNNKNYASLMMIDQCE
jgi:hypothetical protein